MQQIRASEISDIIKQEIENFDREVEVRETGTVLSTGDGIARIYGLDRVAAGELNERLANSSHPAPQLMMTRPPESVARPRRCRRPPARDR